MLNKYNNLHRPASIFADKANLKEMMKNNDIIIIEDDADDTFLIAQIFKDLEVKNKVLYFENGKDAFDYFKVMKTQPFFILCDVNMPFLTGIQLRKKTNEDEQLRLKAMPFLFWSTSKSTNTIKEAYELNIQGYFVKPNSYEILKKLIVDIMNYWDISDHPLT